MFDYRKNFMKSKDKVYLTEKIIEDYNNIKQKEN